MNDLPKKPPEMSSEFYDVCVTVTAKRPRTVINHILEHGFITTEELSERYGYDHPPRAVRDVRENGIPLETFKVKSSKTGRQIGAYRFAHLSQIEAGRVGGRKSFSKQFKEQLVKHYGARSMLTNEELEPRYLQIDHRIPYQIAGNHAGEKIEYYMLLDASAQRAKSWSCENCENFRSIKDASICGGCFWAYPENYKHIAMRPERRVDVVWSGTEVTNFEALTEHAEKYNLSTQEVIKKAVAAFLSRRE